MGILSLFSQSLANDKYVFLDVETTGLYPLLDDKIIEIALIKTNKGKIIDTYNTFINPMIPIPIEASSINNISDDMVKDAPVFDKELSETILDFLDDHILVAHNAPFDIGFLSAEFGRTGFTFERWKSLDTLKIANNLFAGQRNRLENIMRRYSIMPDGNLHRALADTDALRKVFFELIEESEIRSKNIDEIIKIYGFQGNNLHRFIPAIVRESIIEKKVINGQYRKRDGNLIDLSVLPKSAVWVDNKWFLLAEELNNSKYLYLYCENFYNITN